MKHKDTLNLIDKLLDTETPIQDRRVRQARRHQEGRNTRLTQSVWFATVFELNELYAMRGQYDKVMNDRQILHNWELEYVGHLKYGKDSVYKPCGAILSGKITVGMYRRYYRKATLYKGQLKPILYSFRYTKDKEPRGDGRTLEMLLLEDCRKLCLEYKIADPRFFSPEELAKIRTHAKKESRIHEWGIPSPQQYKDLDASVAGGVYQAYKLYDNPYDPTGWSPPEDD